MKPIYETHNGRLYCGHSIEILQDLPDGCIQTCITSPPYWGLRDYGLQPMVWGGDRTCRHEWNIELNGKSKSGSLKGSTLLGTKPGIERRAEWSSCFCKLCGAWLGSFGLEPTPELYVEHAVEIFREVWRVLQDDGTLWLNLGDSYSSGSRELNNHNKSFFGNNTAKAKALGPKKAPPGYNAL